MLYGLGVGLRNMLFDMGVLRSRSFTIPIISVGNITIGGAGKTPHVEYLIRLLQKRVRIAVLSRGYKRKTKGYVLADENVTAREIGDEPFQMYSKYGNDIYIAVNANRCQGIDRLRHDEQTKDTDVILLDDAYQHRYVKPGVNILLVDYHRLIVYDKLLPAGRLREPKEGKRRADVVIITKCPADLRPMDFRVITKALDLYPYQKLFFTTLVYTEMKPVFKPLPTRSSFSTLRFPRFKGTEPPSVEKAQVEKAHASGLADITPQHHVLVVTGIASPQHLLADMQKHTRHIKSLSFSDHHDFTEKDISRINNLFDELPQPRLIITTEKDAARLVTIDGFSDDVRRNTYALPIEIKFMLEQEEEFNDYILNYVQANSRNSILSKLKDSEKAEKNKKINFRN